jgi:hypothetical protein
VVQERQADGQGDVGEDSAACFSFFGARVLIFTVAGFTAKTRPWRTRFVNKISPVRSASFFISASTCGAVPPGRRAQLSPERHKGAGGRI